MTLTVPDRCHFDLKTTIKMRQFKESGHGKFWIQQNDKEIDNCTAKLMNLKLTVKWNLISKLKFKLSCV